MITNNAGLALIKKFEGLRLKAYLCPAGVWTIGYGHTGPDVFNGATIREIDAEIYLKSDLMRFEHCVETATQGVPTTPNQFSAMVCLAFNIGSGAFLKSSVLRYHKQGKHQLAANAFLLWVFVKKQKVTGLVRRRTAERSLYVS